MSSQVDASTVLQLLLGGGVLAAIAEVVRWITTRNRARVDAAAVVQEAALELLEPIRNELRQARSEASDLRAEMTELRDTFDQIYAWARMARRELDARGAIGVPPLPPVQLTRFRRTNGTPS